MQFGEWKIKPYLVLYAKDSFFRKYLASLDNWGDEKPPSKNKEKCIFQYLEAMCIVRTGVRLYRTFKF